MTTASDAEATEVASQDSASQDSTERHSDTSASVDTQSARVPKRKNATGPEREDNSKPNAQKQPEEDAESVGRASKQDSPFLVAPKQLDTAALGQLVLRHGLSHRDPIVVIAAAKILATAADPVSAANKVNEYLDNAAQFADTNDSLVPMLVEHVRDYSESGQALTVQDNNERWAVGSGGLTDVGVGEIVFQYGLKRDDPLSHVVGLLLLAGATQQEGLPSRKELNQRIQTFLNDADKPIWIMLADRVYDVMHQRSHEEMQQRPGEDWPAFLGPTADSRSSEDQLVREWPFSGPPVVWQFDAGDGFAACSIQGGRLYLFDRVNDYNRLVCIDQETGEMHGQPFTYPAPTDSPGGYQGPRCSPVLDGDRIYIFDEAGMLHCLRAETNEVLWKVDTAREFSVTANRFGVAATPKIVGELLIAVVGGGGFDSSSSQSSMRAPKPNGSALVGFDKLTGNVAYASGNFLADYASPVTAEIDGVQWGFALLREGLVGFAPASGKITSYYPWRPEDLSSVNCASPVVVENEVFVSNAFGQGSALLTAEPSRFTPVWADDPGSPEKKLEAYFSTPVYQDGYLYGCSGKDSHRCELRCIDWSTGELMWSEPGLNRVSLLLANGQLICLSEYGVLYLVDATPEEYRLVSKVTLQGSTPDRLPPGFTVPNLLEYPCWSAPVLSRGYLYLRSPNKLVCLDLSLPDAMNQQKMASTKARVVSYSAPPWMNRQVEPLEVPAPSGAPPIPLKRPDVEDSPVAKETADYMPIERTRFVSYEPPPKGWLGVFGDSDGVNLVNSVAVNSPAHQSGVRAGDTILSVDGYSTNDFATVNAELQLKRAGQSVDIVLRRNGTEQTITAILDAQPSFDKWAWISPEGIRYTADVRSVDGERVTFSISNGTEVTHMLSELSDESRELIKSGAYDDGASPHGGDVERQTQPRSALNDSSDNVTPGDSTNGRSVGENYLIESRIWTNSKGMTIDAAVMSIDGDKVSFLRSDGRQGAYLIADLSEPDQELINIVRRIADK